MTNDQLPDNNRPATHLASAWHALCGLPTTHSWFWLARSAPFATAPSAEMLPLLFMVLLDGLSGLLGGTGTGGCGHG